MPVIRQILLRTKITGPVLSTDLQNREIAVGYIDKNLYIKNYSDTVGAGELLRFLHVDDEVQTVSNTWSAERIHFEIENGGGSGTNYNRVYGEIAGGSINNNNLIFTTLYQFVLTSLEVFLNGLKLIEGAGYDYILRSNMSFQFNLPPMIGDEILVNYDKVV